MTPSKKSSSVTSLPVCWPWANTLRVFAIFLVVLLHVSAGYVYQWGQLSSILWWSANIFDSFARISVPLFVMLSGALLLGKTDSPAQFVTKRVWRLLRPWLFWTAVYVAWAMFWHGAVITSFAELKKLAIETFLGGNWFLVMLMGVYLLLPVWRLWVQRARVWEWAYVLGGWFVLMSVLPFMRIFAQGSWTSTWPWAIQFSGYALLGYALSCRVPLSFRVHTRWLVLAAIICSLFTALLTGWLTQTHLAFADSFYEYLSPLQVLAASLWFVAIMSLRSLRMTTLSRTLAPLAFGIYFIHIILLEILQTVWAKFFPTNISNATIFYIPLVTIIVFALSAAIIKLAQHTPLKHFVS